MSKLQAIVVNSQDNVATAVTNLQEGTTVILFLEEGRLAIKLREPISLGHKFSITQIEDGSDIIKYGEVIGYASKPIEAGKHVHVHNVLGNRGRGDLPKEAI
jgi:altronate dehydratase small subunit